MKDTIVHFSNPVRIHYISNNTVNSYCCRASTVKSSCSRYWRHVRRSKLVQLTPNMQWLFLRSCLFCFHLLPFQTPKLQVLGSLEEGDVTLYRYDGVKEHQNLQGC